MKTMKFTRTKQIAAIMSVLFLSACASMQKPGLERDSLVQSDPIQIKQQDAQPDVVSTSFCRWKNLKPAPVVLHLGAARKQGGKDDDQNKAGKKPLFIHGRNWFKKIPVLLAYM